MSTAHQPRESSQQEELRLRLIADALPAYIAYVDAEQRYLMVNETYLQTLGLRQDQIIGRRVEEIVGASFAVIGPRLAAALTGESQKFETHLWGREGERVLGVSHIPDRDESGRVRGVIIHAIDITDMRRAELALQSSDERLNMALAAANGIGLWDWDLRNDMVRSDATFALFYGVDPGWAKIGAPISEFTRNVHPEDLDRVQEAIATAIHTCEEYNQEYRIVRSDGSPRWLSTRGRCVPDVNGKSIRFPGVAIDITDRKLSEGALVQAEKLAAVGRLASSIAHEINNPLESVVNLLFLIEHGVDQDPAQVREYAHLAQSELSRVSQIVTQTLRFFKQSTRATVVNASELIASVLALYQGRLANSAIEVERQVRENTAGLCFEGELRQVLNNLIGNALDAMRERGGRLTVRARIAKDPVTRRPGFRITVFDTGPGIDATHVQRIFEPFFTTKGIMGTGLGLWVSVEIMHKHEGTLKVRSSQHSGNTGTAFTLFMPFASPNAQ